MRRPRAAVTPLVEGTVRAGDRARVALKVSLPEGLHTQSNKPRDPNLIPTVLTIDAPAGVTISEVVWPPATDFTVAGQDQPLAVFEHEFVLGIELALAPTVAQGPLTIPAHLRYQACDANLCYAPLTDNSQWTLTVGATASADPANAATFKGIKFGSGERYPGTEILSRCCPLSIFRALPEAISARASF
jgi:DsbC/DsbD-like thiol-disulfide interchange protein